MKLQLVLIICTIVLGARCAVAPRRNMHHGGISSVHSYTASKQSHKYSSGFSYGSRSGAGSMSRNKTSDLLPPRELSNTDFHMNSTVSAFAPASAAPTLSRRTIPRYYNWNKRNSLVGHRHHSSSLRGSHLPTGVYSVPQHYVKTENTHVNDSSQANIEKRPPMKARAVDAAPTPAPTGSASPDTTVFINNENDFALLLPKNPGERISDAETDGAAFCTAGGCPRVLKEGFITAAAVTRAPDNVSWIQVTGCIDPSKISLSPEDDGGQFDVRFPNGAQCTVGGYGASFIEQVEPSARRFCLRCCAKANDQTSCNSHQDRSGCVVAIPGIYDFPEKGVFCA